MNILTINSGSSSIKFSLYRMEEREEQVASGRAEGIGLDSGLFQVKDGTGKVVTEKSQALPGHAAALQELTKWLDEAGEDRPIDAIGHRIVHGGSSYTEPHAITEGLLTALDGLIPFAPDHLPHELDAVRELSRRYPGVRQVACFDTAFHRSMPPVARLYALPEGVRQQGVERYGFHGLSYEYILGELAKIAGPASAAGRVIVAHLGNGASMAAFRNGKSMDTTMGFTPAGGLVMSTRSGDLDPGIMVYLLKNEGMDVAGLNRMVNKEAGLLGVSGVSSDMQELLVREATDPRAAAAVELFCYQARKFIGALAAALGGIDTLVFTGGIGENAALVRERICEGIGFLGIQIDGKQNRRHAPIVSRDNGPVVVRVMKTNEELMIARHTYRLMNKKKDLSILR